MNYLTEEEALALLQSRDQKLTKHLKRIKDLERRLEALEQK